MFSMVAHEYAHGYAALKQGDPTAYQLGRLSWNPLKHIDPFMTVLMPLLTYFGSGGSMMFGGAKPVPVVPRNYRNYRRGDIIVSMAGIVVNLILAVLCLLLFLVLGLIGRALPVLHETLALLQAMMTRGIEINLVLAMFNLIPIPPLDGSHVVKYLLPPAWALRYQQVGMFGILILLLMLSTGIGSRFISLWFTPAFLLFGPALQFVAPFHLRSSFLSGA